VKEDDIAHYRAGYVTAKTDGWPASVDRHRVPYHTKHYDILALNKDTMVWREVNQNPVVVRKLYYGRGPISWWREHLFAFRVEREYQALSYLAERGVPCSEPIEWTRGVDPYLGHRYEVLSTKEIPNAVTFESMWRDEELGLEGKLPVLKQCLQLIRQVHEAGLYHGALYIRNVMVQQTAEGWQPFIIDTPKAVRCYKSLVGDNLARIDLCHFLKPLLAKLTNEQLLEILAAYGMENHAAQRFILYIHKYRGGKHQRNKERAYAMLRSLGVRENA